jgi:hypothetical protein
MTGKKVHARKTLIHHTDPTAPSPRERDLARETRTRQVGAPRPDQPLGDGEAIDAIIEQMKKEDAAPQRTPIVLQTKKWTWSKELGNCSGCHNTFVRVAIFSRTNVGPVQLCANCKMDAEDNTYGSIDALNRTVYHGVKGT